MTEMKELSTLLQHALSSENSIRLQAEQEIDCLTSCGGFLRHLARYAYLNVETIPQCHRLLVLSILKQKVGLVAIEECVDVNNILVNMLCVEEDRLVANLSAVVISLIILKMECIGETEHDVISEPMHFFMNFLFDAFIKADSTRLELNAMILVLELLNHLSLSSVSRNELLRLAPYLFRRAISDTPSESNYMALNVLRDLILPLAPIRKFPMLRLIKETWESFFPALAAALLTPTFPSKGQQECDFRNRQTLGFMTFVDGMLRVAKWTRQYITASIFYGLLTRNEVESNVYLEALQNTDSSEDASLVIQQIMAKRWELLGFMVQMKSLRNVVDNIVVNNLPSLLNLVLLYTTVSDIEAREWLVDANTFLRQEEEHEDEVVWSVRDTTADFCRICVSVLGEGGDVLRFLVATLDSAEESCKRRESVLFVLEVLLRRCPNEMLAAGEDCHSQLLQILLKKDVHGPPLLSSRALSVLSILLALMKRAGADVASLCASLLPEALVSLSSSVPLLSAAACRLFHSLVPLADVDDVLTLFFKGQDALFSLLLNETTSDEFLYLCLEVYTEWISQCHLKRRDVASSESYNNLFRCWRNHIQDPNMGELVVSVFGELIIDSGGDEFLTIHFSWLADVLNSPCGVAEYCVIPFVVQMLTYIFEKGSNQVAMRAADTLVGSLCRLLLATEESSIISSASACLAALLQRCPHVGTMKVCVPNSLMKGSFPELCMEQSVLGDFAGLATLQRGDLQPHPFSSILVMIVMTMLRDEVKEASLMNAGRVLVAIGYNTSAFRDDEIERLITTIVRRLMTVCTDTVTEELVAPLAVLMKLHIHAFINVLLSSGIFLDTFSVWLPKMSIFIGKQVLFDSCDALLDFLLQWPLDERLCGQLLTWIDRKRNAVKLPLEVAIFVGVGRGVLNLAMQASLDDEEDEEEEQGDGMDDKDEVVVEEDEEEEEEQREKVVVKKVLCGEVSHDLRHLLQKVSPLVLKYGPAAAVCFSRSELKELSDLLQIIKAS
ncbi:hypothetical protein TraAM80_06670 [Trypanosoma rangeli]|uniref:Uncharacterized protein n=1 Tax=Trypanosoma rangeli TaxID=5698 RepID=A0A422N9B7_TRYRA|nr:uncharacterized protein TraAM80_06670 [Trypanosoma rangeli]RNF02041.1 hypothetical protein TraAM80_06670 [Trypanosoma rangeli]|eukprot:RNF02041.1 hypothetical protein TraAM80_06670 [Trypanosoma rangeli]